jgi:hypothetical protein
LYLQNPPVGTSVAEVAGVATEEDKTIKEFFG